MEGNLIDSARKGQSKIRYAALICSTVALVATTLFYSELASRTGLLSTLKEGGQTCFTRVGQSFTAKILNQTSTDYLSKSFFSATEECYGDLINGWQKEFSKQKESSHLLNTLVSNIHWFHAKLDGRSSALKGKDAGKGDFGDRYTFIEELKGRFDSNIEATSAEYHSSINYIKMTMFSLSFVVLLLMGIEFYSIKRRRSLNKMIELRAEDLIASRQFLGEEVEDLVVSALEQNELDGCSTLFKKYAAEKPEVVAQKEADFDVFVELEPEMNIELELEPEINVELELESEMNIELELAPEPAPEVTLDIELELAPEPAPEVTLDIELESEDSLIDNSTWQNEICESIDDTIEETPYFTAPEVSPAPVQEKAKRKVASSLMTPVNVGQALDAVFESLDAKLIEEQIAVDVKGDEQLLVSASGECMEQVFFNLISNSILRLRKLPPLKRIHIFIHEIDGKVIIDYADNGEEIPRSIVENRGSDSIVGIGLAISKSLIEESAGQITFENSKDFGRHTQITLDKVQEKIISPRQLTTVMKGTKRDVMRRLEAMM